MIVVTGAAGFIGSAVARVLAAEGHSVVAVDDLTDGDKFRNLLGVDLDDYLDRETFEAMVDRDDSALARVTAVVHQGACADTTVRDGRRMLRDNFDASKRVAGLCARRRVPLVYASSAAVYGASTTCREEPAWEAPLNVYGWSKLLFDQWVRRHWLRDPPAPIVGLRYFNVYGPGEAHKGPMASVAWQLHRQALAEQRARLFGEGEGAGPGEHRRDFVHVDDVAAVVRWFVMNPGASGIFNVGTGEDRSFRELAALVLQAHGLGDAALSFVPFPDALRGRYQSRTRADLARLRARGCDVVFRPIEAGVPDYLSRL